jgi:Helix-turn-helix domain
MARPLILPPLDIRQRYTIDETGAYLRQSRAKTYNDIAAGKLPVIKDGKRTYIPGSAIAERSRVSA